MGSKKKPKHKKKAGKKSSKSKAVPKLRTPFMAAFTDRFIRDSESGEQKFVLPNQGEIKVYENFALVLATLGEQNSFSKPVSGGTSSLRDQVIDFLNAEQWPDHTAVPKKYKGAERMVHLIEMAVIADRLLEAMNEGFGGSGGPTSWPPHG